MKIHSIVIAFFLVTSTFLSARSSAQTYSIQPTSELEASQEAYRLGAEIQGNELPTTEVQKGEDRSTDAMHWTAVFVNQTSQHVLNNSDKAVKSKKLAASKISVSKRINQPVKIIAKPVYN